MILCQSSVKGKYVKRDMKNKTEEILIKDADLESLRHVYLRRLILDFSDVFDLIDDFEDDLDFNMEPEPSKAKRVSSRANKGAREEDEDFETMPSFQKVLRSFTLNRVLIFIHTSLLKL